MQRKNEGKKSTQSKIKAIRELQKSISSKQFLENTPNLAETTFERNCIIESSRRPQRAPPVRKTNLRKSSKGIEYLTEPTNDFSYSQNYKAKNKTNYSSTDLTKAIIHENKLQVLNIEIENISEQISPSHGDQPSRPPTRDISVRELPPSNDPSPISSAQHLSANPGPPYPILFDSILLDESIILKNKPRSKLQITRIESSFSKSKLLPNKPPKTLVPQTESLQKNPKTRPKPKPTTSTFTAQPKTGPNNTDQSCL
jgi:hypothetical protein